jgi:hypothetical protein
MEEGLFSDGMWCVVSVVSVLSQVLISYAEGATAAQGIDTVFWLLCRSNFIFYISLSIE